MHLDKLFGSKTKVDILKYLLFRRQGISMRALENELTRTFPAIKKQIDSMHAANVLDIDKDSAKRSIVLKPNVHDDIRNIFMCSLKNQIIDMFKTYEVMIDNFYFGKTFGKELDMDLIVIYKNCEQPQREEIKKTISEIFRDYFIDNISMVFMSADERQKRYRLADKFVLNIMRTLPDKK